LDAINTIEEPSVFSLAGVALVYSGWIELSISMFKASPLAVKP
jgi:hypothetical protein